jgi:hypothetical protein
MTQTKLLIGSLSNDLYRVANLTQRGSYQAAERFFVESKRWITDLSNVKVKGYIRKIIDDLERENNNVLSLEKAEKFLMYSILLQNYSLHLK